MGLMDRILGGFSGSSAGRPPVGVGTDGRARVMRALLPVVIALLANRQRGTLGAGTVPGWGRSGPGRAGGLGGLAGLGAAGGIGGLLAALATRGYSNQVDSWVGTGENEPLPTDAMDHLFDPDELTDIASRAGLAPDEARWGLSELLPQVVDDLTPDGHIPSDDEMLLRLDGYERDLPG